MAQVVLVFIVMTAVMFYILFKAPQTDAQTPAQAALAATAASVPPPPLSAISEPVIETRAAPTSAPATPESAMASVPAAASSMAASASAPAVKP